MHDGEWTKIADVGFDLRRPGKTALNAQATDLFASVKLGHCNATGCVVRTEGAHDAFCGEHWRLLPKPFRSELVKARDTWRRGMSGGIRTSEWPKYAMPIIGARLWFDTDDGKLALADRVDALAAIAHHRDLSGALQNRIIGGAEAVEKGEL